MPENGPILQVHDSDEVDKVDDVNEDSVDDQLMCTRVLELVPEK